MGIHGVEQTWMNNYLKNRSQCVKMSGCTSDLMEINYGVPQGSILGPLLFTIYINNLPKVTQNSKVVLYADDTVLFVASKDIKEVENSLSKDLIAVNKWLYKNKLTLNVKKTKCMVFGSSTKLNKTEKLNITCGNSILEQVSLFKYLGLWFDPNLTWAAHIDKICSKVSQRIGILYRTRSYINPGIANKIYKALILPVMYYGDIIWSTGVMSNIARVKRLQNRAGRIILRCNRRTHKTDIHKSLNWLYSRNRSSLNQTLMVAKNLFILLYECILYE